jgi:hypothetical protein
MRGQTQIKFNLCVFENIMSKKIFWHKSYEEKEGENYKTRSLKKNETSEACDMRVEKTKYILFFCKLQKEMLLTVARLYRGLNKN